MRAARSHNCSGLQNIKPEKLCQDFYGSCVTFRFFDLSIITGVSTSSAIKVL